MIKFYRLALAAAIVMLCLVCGCESGGEECLDFADNPNSSEPQGCVPKNFDPENIDFTQPCDNEYLKICTADEGDACLGFICEKGEWKNTYMMQGARCESAPCQFKTKSSLIVKDGDMNEGALEPEPDPEPENELEIEGEVENATEEEETAAGFIIADPNELNFGALSLGQRVDKELLLQADSSASGVLINKITFATPTNYDYLANVTGITEDAVYLKSGDLYKIVVELTHIRDSGEESPLKCGSPFNSALTISYEGVRSPLIVRVYSHPKCK